MIHLIVLILCCVASFYLGIVVGISDCKRRFNISRGATYYIIMDTTTIESLLAMNVELLKHIYAIQLWTIGVCGACLVLFLLYKFLRKFF